MFLFAGQLLLGSYILRSSMRHRKCLELVYNSEEFHQHTQAKAIRLLIPIRYCSLEMCVKDKTDPHVDEKLNGISFVEFSKDQCLQIPRSIETFGLKLFGKNLFTK